MVASEMAYILTAEQMLGAMGASEIMCGGAESRRADLLKVQLVKVLRRIPTRTNFRRLAADIQRLLAVQGTSIALDGGHLKRTHCLAANLDKSIQILDYRLQGLMMKGSQQAL
jgi:hypothetical protein